MLNRKIVKWVGIVIAGIVIFVGVAYLLVTVLTKDAVEVVNQEFSVLRADNLTDAYYKYMSQPFRANASFSQFQQFVDAYPILTQNTGIKYSGKSISTGKGVELTGTLVGADGPEATISIQLIKEDGAWKIQYLNIKPIED